MSKFNPYDLIERYRKGTIDMSLEIVPKEPAFKTIPGEQKELVTIESQNEFYHLVRNMELGNFSELDIAIVCLTAQFKYITSKQILENLTLMGFDTNDTKVTNSINKLHKNQLVYMFKFASPDGRKTNFRVVTLDRFGYQMAQQLEVPCNWSVFEKIDSVARIKKYLAGNQLRNAFLKSGLEIEWLYSRKNIFGKEKGQIVKPAFYMMMDGNIFCFEVVRRYEFWQQELADKLLRYEEVFSNPLDNSLMLEEKPLLIFNGEDEEHNTEINAIIKELNLSFDVMFTHDMLHFGKKFKYSLYQLNEDNNAEYFELPIQFNDSITQMNVSENASAISA